LEGLEISAFRKRSLRTELSTLKLSDIAIASGETRGKEDENSPEKKGKGAPLKIAVAGP